ncbi:hypothetical protein BCV70DRAFT_10088 [Testicularia cyperi]|uniref:Restriction endonuclease type IV Mrr domain-containing protein n=1 Tax=Testicularia cyperi TaxID=1882483 RepID=A0A317XYL9_9BASI|nr:hypothetical protein BCV70DRAFT_10088 [Testicularia cyperi]
MLSAYKTLARCGAQQSFLRRPTSWWCLARAKTFCTAETARIPIRRPSQAGTSASSSHEVESTVARGTRFELLCQAALHEIFGMELERTGGAGDKGIDLRGWWNPPSLSEATPNRRVRILAQCKCQDEGGKKMGPVLIREVEGVLHRASSPASLSSPSETPEVVAGVILSSSGFSPKALIQVKSSILPLVAIHVLAERTSNVHFQEGGDRRIGSAGDRCVSIVWNDRFGSRQYGILGGELELRWERLLDSQAQHSDGQNVVGRPVLFHNGKRLHRH